MSESEKNAPAGGEKNKFYERTPYFLLFAAALQLILGFLLLAFPDMLSGVLGTVGVALLVIGVFLFLRYFIKKGYQKRNDYSFSFGLLLMIAALGVFARNSYLMLWVPGIMGALVVVTSMVRIQCAVDGLLMKGKYWFIHGITAIVACVMAYFLISGNTVYVASGMVDKYVCIVLLLDAVFNIITTFLMYVEDGTDEKERE